MSNSFIVPLKKLIIVIGAGMAGLAAARQLHSFGYRVVILEARNRAGGRCNTDWSTGGGVDLGASIITGLEGNPLTNLCTQLNTRLHKLKFDCPLFVDGNLVDESTDKRLEQEFNNILEEAGKESNPLPPSLGEAIAQLMQQKHLTDVERRILHWHIANLEYACATDLSKVSRTHWDQDDSYEWQGAHCLLRDGYESLAKQLAKDLDIKFNTIVQTVESTELGVKIHTSKGAITGDAVVITLPLGVLKAR